MGGGTCLNAPVSHPEGVNPYPQGILSRTTRTLVYDTSKKSSLCTKLKAGLPRLKPRNDIFAFTLAEVLITLGIIGVAAALTMPALIASHKEKETSVKLKKVYSTLSQAYISATNRYEAPENWVWEPSGSAAAANNILDYLADYLVISKRCTNSPKCLPDVTYKRLNGTNHANYNREGTGSTLILNDGTVVYLWTSGVCTKTSPDCGFIYVDINGRTGPNQFGRDFFGFILTPSTIIPFGIEDHSYKFSTSCKRNTDSYLNGLGCTAWVIQNENMDYLHCDDLSFTDKSKCN